MKIGFCSLSLTEDRLSRFGKGCILYACALPWQGRLVPGGGLNRKPPLPDRTCVCAAAGETVIIDLV